MELETALYKHFKYSSFRPQQKEIIASILRGQDTIALLPTGAGKSICFQLPALLLPGITLVVTPLIALMQDQVDTLIRKGIYATYISSTLSRDEVSSRMQLLKLNKYKLLYISPERLAQKKFINLCRKLKISLVVIDEAHCISEWGHDFRPAYLTISHFLNLFVNRPTVAAFTATATSKTLIDIQLSLKMNNQTVYRSSFLRSNINIHIIKTESTQFQEILTLFLLQKHQLQSGIVYVSTRKAAEYLTTVIKKYFKDAIKVGCYHGDLPAKERDFIQKLFMADKLKVVVATSAFGMGIDKSNISFVIHFHYPSSVEAYYQEIGRGGRGGEMAHCYLLFNPKNNEIHTTLAAQITSEVDKKNKLNKLAKIEEYARSPKCRMLKILEYFAEEKPECCGNCDICQTNKNDLQNPLNIPSKLKLLFTSQQQERIGILHQKRLELKKRFSLSQYAEVITDNQLLLLALLKPQKASDLTDLPGFGRGWQVRWAEHFILTSGKIP